MKIKILIPFLIMFLLDVAPVLAGIDLPWSTTFDCAEWTSGDALDCDDLIDGGYYENYDDCNPTHEQIISAANNPSGGGGRGQAHYVCGDCGGFGAAWPSSSSEGLVIDFNTNQTEFWIRWYAKYQSGFNYYEDWTSQKIIYLFDTTHTYNPVIKYDYANSFGLIVQVPEAEFLDSDGGWTTTMGSTEGDGQWHYYEVHVKTDTNGSNGVFEFWIDNRSAQSFTTVNYSQAVFDYFILGSNFHGVCGSYVVYFDDIAISNTGRIGPLGETSQSSNISGNISIGSQ
jgi:hypothetical protein